jgi:hypothetical protein
MEKPGYSAIKVPMPWSKYIYMGHVTHLKKMYCCHSFLD